jgi:hypothetical protein
MNLDYCFMLNVISLHHNIPHGILVLKVKS